MEIPTGYGLITHGYVSEGDSDEMVNTFGVLLDSGLPTPSELSDFGDAWRTVWSGHISDIIHRTVIRCYESEADGGNISEFFFTDGDFGDSAGNPLPNNSAVIMRKSTALGGRKHRGRCFIPGVLLGDTVDDGGLSSGAIAALNTALGAWLATFPDYGVNSLQLLHTDATAPDLITGLSVSQRLATTRHRYRN